MPTHMHTYIHICAHIDAYTHMCAHMLTNTVTHTCLSVHAYTYAPPTQSVNFRCKCMFSQKDLERGNLVLADSSCLSPGDC